MDCCQCCLKAGEEVAKTIGYVVEHGWVIAKEVCKKCLKPIAVTSLSAVMFWHCGAHPVGEYGVPQRDHVRTDSVAAVTSGQSGQTSQDVMRRW
jgi:hypothetical protein